MNKPRTNHVVWSWEAISALCCFAGGIVAALLGSGLTVITWIVGGEMHPWLRGLGTGFLILTIPLLILAGYCLDWMERKRKSPDSDPSHGGNNCRNGDLGVVGAIIFTGLLLLPGDLCAQQLSRPQPQTSQVSANNGDSHHSKEIPPTGEATSVDNKRKLTLEESPAAPSDGQWQYGGFIDLGYLLDFNHPANRLFRSRGTTFRVDRLHLNMAGVYAKKKASKQSRWGIELTAHAGKDSEVFGFSATAPNIGGFKFLRQLGPTNVSYLAPVGKGLSLRAGIFGSLIGYDSLYAKDNFNYTRPWGADFTPYFMMGANASYPLNEKVTGTFFVVNGYWHLARANNVPSSGGQIAYKFNPRVTVKETLLFGPHQSNTAFKFWRFLTDTIVERETDRVTLAFEYIYSQERVDADGSPRALMMSSQLPVRWTMNKRWAVAVRPEVFWDRDGRWTLARQTVKAITTTLEYRIPYRQTNSILRLEHRYDDSRGPDGGFFRGPEVRPGTVGLTPTQHVLILGIMFTFDR